MSPQRAIRDGCGAGKPEADGELPWIGIFGAAGIASLPMIASPGMIEPAAATSQLEDSRLRSGEGSAHPLEVADGGSMRLLVYVPAGFPAGGGRGQPARGPANGAIT
jgi:hypothetical protein